MPRRAAQPLPERRPNPDRTCTPGEIAGIDRFKNVPTAPINTRMRSTTATALLALVATHLGGCGGTPSAVTAAAVPSERTIEILSLPRNCVVEMAGEYMGATPLKISVPATPDGRWQGSPGTVHAISVSTPNNRFVETKKWRGGDPLPQRLLFRPPYAQQ